MRGLMQDFPMLGFTSQFSITHNRNDESGDHYDNNGFLVRPALVGDAQPHDYSVTYLGYSGDGSLYYLWQKLRLNLSTSSYLAVGTDSHSPIAGREQTILAAFHASEISRDYNWIRLRGNLLFATGDGGQIYLGIQNAREWTRFCADVLRRPALSDDSRFTTNSASVFSGISPRMRR